MTAAVRILGEQGARTGPYLIPIISSWWLLLTGVPYYQQYAGPNGGRPPWSHRPHLQIEKVAERTGVTYLDSYGGLASLIEGTEQHEYYYRNDMHFNPEGLETWSRLHIEAITDPENRLLPDSILESATH